MNHLTAISRAEPGSAGAVKAVSVISTGTVQIRPEHPYGTRKPLYWWLLTSRRWTPPRPINVYVIEHAKGLILFDTGQDRASVTDSTYFPRGFAGYLYRRLARFDIGEHDTLTAHLAALGYAPADVDTAIVSHLHQAPRRRSPASARREHPQGPRAARAAAGPCRAARPRPGSRPAAAGQLTPEDRDGSLPRSTHGYRCA